MEAEFDVMNQTVIQAQYTNLIIVSCMEAENYNFPNRVGKIQSESESDSGSDSNSASESGKSHPL